MTGGVFATIEYDSESFSQAANNGQMIEEMNPKAKSAEKFRDIAMAMTHRKDTKADKKPQASTSALAPLFEKLKFKR